MKHHQDKKTAMKNGYTARNNHHVIVKNLSHFMQWSCFLKLATDGDFTTSSDRLFQASTTLLLKTYFLTSVEQKCLLSLR